MCQFVRVAAIVFVFASSALAQFDFKDVQLRTAYAGSKQGQKGRLAVNAQTITFQKKEGQKFFSIPTTAVNEIFYSRVSGRRIGAAILVSPLLLFSKGRKHYMTLSFDDGGKQKGAIEFKLHKSNYRGVLRTVEQITGVTMKVDGEGIKDKEQTVATREAPGDQPSNEAPGDQPSNEGDQAR